MEVLIRTMRFSLGRRQNELAIFLPFSGRSVSRTSIAQGGGEILDRLIQKSGRFRAGDLVGFLVENSDTAVDSGRDHAGRQILQEDLIVDFGVLDLGEELGVIDRHGELAAQNLQRLLLDAAINPSGHPRTQQHDPGKVFAGKNTDGHRDLQRLHLLFDRFQFRRLPHTVQLVEDQCLRMGFQIFDYRVVFAEPELRTAIRRSGSGYCCEKSWWSGRRMYTVSVATAPAMVFAKRSSKSCNVVTDFRMAAASFMVERKSSRRVPRKSLSARLCETPRAGAMANATTIAATTWAALSVTEEAQRRRDQPPD